MNPVINFTGLLPHISERCGPPPLLSRRPIFPSHTMNDMPDGSKIDVKFSPNGHERCSAFAPSSNCLNSFPGKLGLAITFPSCFVVALTALVNHIGCIVLYRSKPKMVRAHAGRYVAAMKRPQSVLNFTEVNHPRDAMSGIAFVVYAHSPISLPVFFRNPHPAIRRGGLIHAVPKAFNLIGCQIDNLNRLANDLGRRIHTIFMSVLSRFRCSFTGDGAFYFQSEAR